MSCGIMPLLEVTVGARPSGAGPTEDGFECMLPGWPLGPKAALAAAAAAAAAG